jgi:hypothetical protein
MKKLSKKGKRAIIVVSCFLAGLGVAFGAFIATDSVRAAAGEDPIFCVRTPDGTDYAFIGLFYVVHYHPDSFSVPAAEGNDGLVISNARYWVTPWFCK